MELGLERRLEEAVREVEAVRVLRDQETAARAEEVHTQAREIARLDKQCAGASPSLLYTPIHCCIYPGVRLRFLSLRANSPTSLVYYV